MHGDRLDVPRPARNRNAIVTVFPPLSAPFRTLHVFGFVGKHRRVEEGSPRRVKDEDECASVSKETLGRGRDGVDPTTGTCKQQ